MLLENVEFEYVVIFFLVPNRGGAKLERALYLGGIRYLQGGHIRVKIKFPVFSLCSRSISLCYISNKHHFYKWHPPSLTTILSSLLFNNNITLNFLLQEHTTMLTENAPSPCCQFLNFQNFPCLATNFPV